MIDDDILQHVDVEGDIERTSTHGCHLAEDDVLRDTMAIISFADCCRFH